MLPSDQAARTGALLAPPADLGTLTVSGSERLSWLQGVVTCDVAEMKPGEGRWGLILTRQGKILADVLVVAAEHAVRLRVVPAALERALDYLASFLIMEDADIEDSSRSHVWLQLHGPNAVDVATRVVTQVGGEAASIDVTGLGGAAVVVPRAAEARAREAALAAGAVAATEEDLLRLRVERLVPLYGVDMDEHRSPHETSLERRTVSWTKGCYLGQEAVCMQDMRGKVKRRMAIVRVDGTEPPESGSKVLDGAGSPVGETRSAVRSELIGGPVALAFLNAAAAVTGVRLSVNGSSAEVVEPR